jgi:Fe-Mn family superoxide dismutase
MKFTLPDLPYPCDALEPHIDRLTMEIHHGKHHGTYVSNLNEALEGVEGLEDKTIEQVLVDVAELPAAVRQKVMNNGGGHANHSLFWTIMSPDGRREPEGELAEAIESEFGGFAEFREAFKKSALGRFGSGWAWLCVTPERRIEILTTPNQDSPLQLGRTPILGLDVWEHAYYLTYQNRRGEYIDAFFNVIDFEEVERRYAEAMATVSAAKSASKKSRRTA